MAIHPRIRGKIKNTTDENLKYYLKNNKGNAINLRVLQLTKQIEAQENSRVLATTYIGNNKQIFRNDFLGIKLNHVHYQ